MPGNLITKAGMALFGATWQTSLSRAIGVTDRAVRRWAAEERGPSPGVFTDLAQVCRERSAVLLELAEELDAEASKGFSSISEK